MLSIKKDDVTVDSSKERSFIAEQYFTNNEGLAATVHNFRSKYGQKTGSISDLRYWLSFNKPFNINIDTIRESAAESPGTSIQHCVWEFFVKLATAYSRERFTSSQLQSSVVSKTEPH